MQRDPPGEPEPVAEARVDRVLEVRVRVHEAGHDRRVLEALALAEIRGAPDRDDPLALDRDRAVLDRRALDGQHPVGREDAHHGSLTTSPIAARRRSSTPARMIERP